MVLVWSTFYVTSLPRKSKMCAGDLSLPQEVLAFVQYLPERQCYGHEVAYLCEYKLLISSCSACATGRKMVRESGLCGLLVRAVTRGRRYPGLWALLTLFFLCFALCRCWSKKILKHWIKDFFLPHGGCKCLGDETDGKLRLNKNRLSIPLKAPCVKLSTSIGFRTRINLSLLNYE